MDAPPTRTPTGPTGTGCSSGCGSLRPTPARCPVASRRCGGPPNPALHAAASPSPRRPTSAARGRRASVLTAKQQRRVDLPAEAATAGPRRSALAAELGIPGVAEGIAEEVEAEDGQADGEAREDGEPRRLLHESPPRAGQHQPPTPSWGLMLSSTGRAFMEQAP